MGQGYTKGIPIDVDSTFSANSDALVPSQKAVKTYVDNGLATKQATLIGSESVLLPDRLLFKQNVTIVHTGTLLETKIFSVLIPAGTFQANDFFEFEFLNAFSNNARLKTLKVYVNTSNAIGGTLIATQTSTSNESGISPLCRTMVFKNSLSSQNIINPNVSIFNDKSTSNNVVSVTSINFNINQYFIVSSIVTDVIDLVVIRSLKSKISR